MKIGCAAMKQVIEKIVEARDMLTKFHSGEFYLRIENSPYLPLSIQRNGSSVCVTHYFEQNGDLVPDPDMEFVIGTDENWYPVAIQHSNGAYFRARWSEGGRDFIDRLQIQSQTKYAAMWARNIQSQGFIRAGL